MNAKQSLSSISSNQDLWVEQPSFRSSLIYLFSQQSNLRIKPIRRKAPLFVYTKTGRSLFALAQSHDEVYLAKSAAFAPQNRQSVYTAPSSVYIQPAKSSL